MVCGKLFVLRLICQAGGINIVTITLFCGKIIRRLRSAQGIKSAKRLCEIAFRHRKPVIAFGVLKASAYYLWVGKSVLCGGHTIRYKGLSAIFDVYCNIAAVGYINGIVKQSGLKSR